MKTIVFLKYILLFSLFFSCNQAYYNKTNPNSALPVESLSLQASLSFQDSILTVLIANHSKGALYLDTVYTQYFVQFINNQPIYRPGITRVSPETLYPIITYPNENARQKMISANCYKLFAGRSNSVKNVLKLLPDSSYKKSFNVFTKYDIEKFAANIKYEICMNVYLPDGCKSFFPCISTGYIKSDTLRIF